MGCRWSTTPEESQNLAAESFLAQLGIQISGSQNVTSSSTSSLSDGSMASSPAVSYVLTPSVHMPEN